MDKTTHTPYDYVQADVYTKKSRKTMSFDLVNEQNLGQIVRFEHYS